MRDNIKVDVQEMRCGGRDGIYQAPDRNGWPVLVKAVINLRIS
jgi:hypothetical protein